MLYRRELCNLQNPDEAKLLVEIAEQSLKCSMTERKGLLDTEKKVSNAQCSLEKATKADCKKYDEAKRAVLETAQTIFLD